MDPVRAKPGLRVRIFLAVAAGALLVGGGVALLLTNTVALRNTAASSSRASSYLQRAVNLERLVVDAETGLRGNVITGQALFLQPLHRAQAQLPATVAALERAASETGMYQRQTAELIGAVRNYMSVYVPRALGLAAQDLRAARSFSETLAGKQQVDGIRARVAALQGLLTSSQNQRQASARHTASRSIADAIVVLVLLMLLTGVLGGYLGHLAVERERARRQSAETAGILQESILPVENPKIPGCELATRFIPGGGEVGGDFYDVFELEPGRWALVLGDVCGKGARAAAATAMARWSLRSSLTAQATAAEALRFLNDVVRRNDPDGRFITAACMMLSLDADRARIEVACGGHPRPVLVPHDGPASAVAADGDLLGIMPTIRLRTAEVELRPGDSLVAYTDGVTDLGPEARRAPAQALEDRGTSADAEQLAGILTDLAREPPGRHPDDVAIIALRFVGHAAETPSVDAASAIGT
jgi:serine phosphatase RsbU (regulator of sigma subunit)